MDYNLIIEKHIRINSCRVWVKKYFSLPFVPYVGLNITDYNKNHFHISGPLEYSTKDGAFIDWSIDTYNYEDEDKFIEKLKEVWDEVEIEQGD